MCGRYTLSAPSEAVADLFDVAVPRQWKARYNIAPTQGAPAVRVRNGTRELALLRWGLIPSWAKDPAIGARMINARAEGIAGKPSFRHAFATQRALIPADGFYEWATDGKRKQPYHIRRRDGAPFAFAGLWERWRDRAHAEGLETYSIITTAPNELLAPIHNRMPVILSPGDFERWLDPDRPGDIELLRPYPAAALEAVPVSPWVNSPAHDDPRCIEPAA